MNRTRPVLFVAAIALLAPACTESEAPAPVVAESQVSAPAATSENAAPDNVSDLDADLARARAILRDYAGAGRDLAAAKEIIKSVLVRDRGYAPAYVELARLEYKSGYLSGDDFDRGKLINAEKFLRHAFSLDDDLLQGHLVRARVRLYLGELDEAEESLAASELAGASKDEVDTIRARVAAKYHDVSGAMRLARSVIDSETAPDYLKIEMLAFIAPQLEYEGFREEAQATYEKVIELAPDHAWGYGNYASFLLDHGEIDAGMRNAERAVEIMPYPIGLRILARAYVMRAEQLIGEQRYAEAGKVIEKLAKKVGSDDPSVDLMLGNYYYGVFGRTNDVAFLDRAIEKYRAVLRSDPGQEDVARTLQRAIQRRAELGSS